MDKSDEQIADEKALAFLLNALEMERIEVNLFRGPSIHTDWRRVYGGQVLGQALSAATKTVQDERRVHSLHAYFLLAGDPQHPIVYDVEALRDGGSFTTRRVRAIQHGEVIFVMSASFHKHETGMEHTTPMPDVPQPQDCPSVRELFGEGRPGVPPQITKFLAGPQPIEIRPTDPDTYFSGIKREPVEYIWLKVRGHLPDDDGAQTSLLAYISDFTLLQTALIAHGRLMFEPEIQLASLDHAIWFHRPFRAGDWILYANDSPTAAASRAFCRGRFFTADGTLIASTAQEGLMRLRTR